MTTPTTQGELATFRKHNRLILNQMEKFDPAGRYVNGNGQRACNICGYSPEGFEKFLASYAADRLRELVEEFKKRMDIVMVDDKSYRTRYIYKEINNCLQHALDGLKGSKE